MGRQGERKKIYIKKGRPQRGGLPSPPLREKKVGWWAMGDGRWATGDGRRAVGVAGGSQTPSARWPHRCQGVVVHSYLGSARKGKTGKKVFRPPRGKVGAINGGISTQLFSSTFISSWYSNVASSPLDFVDSSSIDVRLKQKKSDQELGSYHTYCLG